MCALHLLSTVLALEDPGMKKIRTCSPWMYSLMGKTPTKWETVTGSKQGAIWGCYHCCYYRVWPLFRPGCFLQPCRLTWAINPFNPEIVCWGPWIKGPGYVTYWNRTIMVGAAIKCQVSHWHYFYILSFLNQWSYQISFLMPCILFWFIGLFKVGFYFF